MVVSMSNVVFTVNVNDGQRDLSYAKYSISAWKTWCKKNGCEFVVLEEEFLNVRPHWYKTFVFKLLDDSGYDYDKVAVVDLDTIPHPDTPNFFDLVDDEIGVVTDDGSFDWTIRSTEIYKKHLFSDLDDFNWYDYFNSGFLILNKKHKETYQKIIDFLFENKDNIEAIQNTYGVGRDQTPLNFLLRQGNKIKHISKKYNLQDLIGRGIGGDDLPFLDVGWIYHYNAMDETQRLNLMKKTYERLYGKDGLYVERHGTIITPDMLHSKGFRGDNINGPSLIKVPDWVENPLGKYYLYFAHHNGKTIRLAYSDNVTGPYTIHNKGVLSVDETEGNDHIASPDVHIDNENQEIVMYYHTPFEDWQYTFKSKSKNGLTFSPESGKLGMFYFRVFELNGRTFAIAKNRNTSGISYELIDNEWVVKDDNFIPNMRHGAVLVENGKVYFFYTIIGEAPESIYWSETDVDTWELKNQDMLIKPTTDMEGAGLPMSPSTTGGVNHRVNQLRDPCVFVEGDKKYLLYTIAGEMGIAIGELNEN